MGERIMLRSALIVVDMQEDFCPPHGSLAVPGGRDIAPIINRLLDLPFALRLGTQDWHPSNHQSFDVAHESSKLRAFIDETSMSNPEDPSVTKKSTVWPVHCVQDTPGANIIGEIDSSKFDMLVKKGMDHRVEMYSGFADIFGNKAGATLDLSAFLKGKGITHVYVVGLTGDCCVRYTALDAQKEGFITFVVQDATRSVDEEKGFVAALQDFREAGVSVIESSGPEIEKVKRLG